MRKAIKGCELSSQLIKTSILIAFLMNDALLSYKTNPMLHVDPTKRRRGLFAIAEKNAVILGFFMPSLLRFTRHYQPGNVCSCKNEIEKTRCRNLFSDALACEGTLFSLFHFVGSRVRFYCPFALLASELAKQMLFARRENNEM